MSVNLGVIQPGQFPPRGLVTENGAVRAVLDTFPDIWSDHKPAEREAKVRNELRRLITNGEVTGDTYFFAVKEVETGYPRPLRPPPTPMHAVLYPLGVMLRLFRSAATPVPTPPAPLEAPAPSEQPIKQSRRPEPKEERSKAKKQRGPKRGTVRRFDDADRELFPELERIMAKEKKSCWRAALDLAEAGKVAGAGTAESRAKRLIALYNH